MWVEANLLPVIFYCLVIWVLLLEIKVWHYQHNEHLSPPQLIEHKKRVTAYDGGSPCNGLGQAQQYDVGSPCNGLGQAQQWNGVIPVNRTQTLDNSIYA